MTRVASGDSGIWLDICMANSLAIQSRLRDLSARLSSIADALGAGDSKVLKEILEIELRNASRSRSLIPERKARTMHLKVEGSEESIGKVQEICERLGVKIEESFERAGSVNIMVSQSVGQAVLGALVARGLDVSEVD